MTEGRTERIGWSAALTMSPTPFEKFFPARALTGDRALRAWFWGVLGALVLAGMLLVLSLLVDLWIHRGLMTLSEQELPQAAAAFGDPPPESGALITTLHDAGLRPTAWREMNNWVGQTLRLAIRAIPTLKTNRGSSATLLFLGVLCALGRIACRARSRRRADEFGLRASSSLRSQLHRQTLRLGLSDLEGERPGHAQALFTSEIERIQDGLSDVMVRLCRDLPTVVVLALVAILVDWKLFLLCLVSLIPCWWIVDYERRQTDARQRQAEDKANAALRLLSDSLRKSRLVRGYAMEQFEHDRFQQHLEEFTNETSEGRRLRYWQLRVARFAAAALVAVMLYCVGARVLGETSPLPASAGMLLMAAFAAATPSMSTLVRLPATRQAIDQSGEAVFAYNNEIPEVGQAVGAKFIEPLSKTIIYEAVSYRRGDRELLKQFDLRVPAGQTVGFVSLDPLQPRSAAYMLPRFIEPQQGRVLFDSEDIAWGTLDSLRAETAYVGGSDPCFNGTVLENITCGESRYAMAEATEAAKLVHAHNFILKLPMGYETPLGERGERIDAGKAFLLGLARAVLRKPALIVIEEPETQLDESTKDLLDDSYQRMAVGRTIIFLPTRLSTVRKCDLIVLFAEGKVAAMGTHSELLRTSDLYKHWEYVSFNTFRKRGLTVVTG
jgi:ABC-type multidrug transport system fused ATPase/permease subunit